MFCPHCGIESAADLNYCKRCGGNLNLVAIAPARGARPAISTGTACVVGVSISLLVLVGLVILFVAMSELRGGGLPPDVFKVIFVFGSLTILGSVASLTWLWTYLLGGAHETANAAQLKAPPAANELGPARPNALADASIPSITEHTTRTLEHAKK